MESSYCQQVGKQPESSQVGSSVLKYHGVSSNSARQMWFAQISKDCKYHYLGLHLREKDAALAYDVKARELYGEGARLNFPNVDDFDPETTRQRRSQSSKYPGVTWDKVNRKWKASTVMVKGQRRNLGRFRSEREAWDAICREKNSEAAP